MEKVIIFESADTTLLYIKGGNRGGDIIRRQKSTHFIHKRTYKWPPKQYWEQITIKLLRHYVSMFRSLLDTP